MRACGFETRALKCLSVCRYTWLYPGRETVKLRKRSRNAFHVACLTLLVPVMVGCTTSASLRPTHRDGILGTPGYYASAPQAAFQAAQQAAEELGFTVTESASDQAYFIARRGMRGGDWGALLGVYLTNTIDDITLIVIRTDPTFSANLNQGDDTTRLHTSLRRKLETP